MSNDIGDKIYASGVKLFNKFGPKKVSIDMIVKDAGVGKGSFYNYYENKEALYENIFENIKKHAFEYMDTLVENYPDPKQRFVVDLLNSLDFFCDDAGIIGGLMACNTDYYIGKINEEYLEETHYEIIESLFRDVHKELFHDEKVLIDFAGGLFGFYKHAKVMKPRFWSDEEFKDFMAQFAVFLVNGLFSPNFSALKDVKYKDYKDNGIIKGKAKVFEQYT